LVETQLQNHQPISFVREGRLELGVAPGRSYSDGCHDNKHVN